MELACAPSAVSNAASSFFGAPMFESSSVISDMPSSASVTDGTARRADASPSEPRRVCCIIFALSRLQRLDVSRGLVGANLTTMLISRSAMLVLACASGFIPPWSVPHARPTRLAASTDSDDRVAAVTELLDALSRAADADARGAALRAAVEQFGDRSALQDLPPPPIDARTARVLVFDRPELGALLGVLALGETAFVRAEVTGRDRGETAPVRFDLRRAEGDAAWALVGVRSEADEDEADDDDDGGEGGGGAPLPDRPSPKLAPEAVLAACVRLIRDGAADALRGFASPRAAAADGFEATLRAQPFSRLRDPGARTTVVSATQASAEHFVAVVRVIPPAPREPPPRPSEPPKPQPPRPMSDFERERRTASAARRVIGGGGGAGLSAIASAAARGGRSPSRNIIEPSKGKAPWKPRWTPGGAAAASADTDTFRVELRFEAIAGGAPGWLVDALEPVV